MKSFLEFRTKFALLGIVVVGALVLTACGGGNNGNQGTGEVAEDFSIFVYQGEDILGASNLSLNQMLGLGKPVVLNFWAGLCPPCRAEMPDLQRVHDKFGDRILLFGLDVGPFVLLGSREDGRELLGDLEVTYPAGSTEDGNVVRAYEIRGMPSTFFIKPNGEIQKEWTGLLNESKMTELIEDLIAAS